MEYNLLLPMLIIYIYLIIYTYLLKNEAWED